MLRLDPINLNVLVGHQHIEALSFLALLLHVTLEVSELRALDIAKLCREMHVQEQGCAAYIQWIWLPSLFWKALQQGIDVANIDITPVLH